MTKPVRLRFERMGEETEKEEKKRKASLATIPAFNSKSKVTQSQIDKFKIKQVHRIEYDCMCGSIYYIRNSNEPNSCNCSGYPLLPFSTVTGRTASFGNLRCKGSQLSIQELNQKLLQIKETNNQKINIKGNSNTRKRPCVELEPKANKDASVTTKCTEPKRPQIFEPAELEEPEHVPQKYKRKLHWGLDTKERWERKSNM